MCGGTPLVQEPTFAKRLSTKVLGAGNQSALARYHNDIRAHFRPFNDTEKARAIKKVKTCSGASVCAATSFTTRRCCCCMCASVRSENMSPCAETVMNLTIEMRERLKAVAVETKQLQADIVALGGTPVEPEKPPEPPPVASKAQRPSGESAARQATAMDEVKQEQTGRGRRKSKGRKR